MKFTMLTFILGLTATLAAGAALYPESSNGNSKRTSIWLPPKNPENNGNSKRTIIWLPPKSPESNDNSKRTEAKEDTSIWLPPKNPQDNGNFKRTYNTIPFLTGHACDKNTKSAKDECVKYCAKDIFSIDEQDCADSTCLQVNVVLGDGLDGVCSCQCYF